MPLLVPPGWAAKVAQLAQHDIGGLAGNVLKQVIQEELAAEVLLAPRLRREVPEDLWLRLDPSVGLGGIVEGARAHVAELRPNRDSLEMPQATRPDPLEKGDEGGLRLCALGESACSLEFQHGLWAPAQVLDCMCLVAHVRLRKPFLPHRQAGIKHWQQLAPNADVRGHGDAACCAIGAR